MNPIWRDRLITAVGAIVAVWLTFYLAEGDLLLPLGAGVIALGLIFVRVTGVRIDAIAVGVLLFGYMVGNRGFAQLTPLPSLPILPAEIGLVVAAASIVWRCSRDKSLPWRRDALNHALLAWIIVGAVRIPFDISRYGFVALRDFATVYYVAFFFIVQHLSREEHIRRFLLRALFVASTCLPFAFMLSEMFPEFFLGTLVFRGVPLIYFKGDLAPTFLAVGGIFLYVTAPLRHRSWSRVLAIGMIGWVFIGDNRASMLGTLVGLAWIVRSRFRSLAFVQVGIVAFAFLLLVAIAGLFDNMWAAKKVRGLTERMMSVADVSGRFTYSEESSHIKSDNNQFRWIWWRTVVSETLAENPAFGLGFGYDLARGFLQEYNPDMAEDFTARSPHNILVTTMGRMGVIGLGILVWILMLIFFRTLHVVRARTSDATQVALWASIWPIAISSGLGVVLEGPMGAVVFWSLLGLASSYRSPPEDLNSTDRGNQHTDSSPDPQSRDRSPMAASTALPT